MAIWYGKGFYYYITYFMEDNVAVNFKVVGKKITKNCGMIKDAHG